MAEGIRKELRRAVLWCSHFTKQLLRRGAALYRNAIKSRSAKQQTLGDYILKALSSKQPVCHPSNAAATGFYDLRKNNWNLNIIRNAGAADISFPEIGTEESVFRLEHVWLHALPAIGDQQAALLGAGLKDKRTLSFNLGTGAQVSRLVSDAACSCRYQIRPYFYNYYLKTLPHIPSGRALNVYIR